MSIRYTLRRLNESECTIDNLKEYELASIKPSGRVVIRLGDQIIDLVDAADNGAIEASRLWAVSEDSPDGEDDAESPTGKTMSSRSWALSTVDRLNEAVTAAQTAATNAAQSAQQVNSVAQQIDTKLDQTNAVAQQINANITIINQRLTQTEANLSQSTTLLDRLIDITDADEVRY